MSGHKCAERCSDLEPNIIGIILAVLFVLFIVIILYYALRESPDCSVRGNRDGRVFICALFALVLLIFIVILGWVWVKCA